MTRSTETPAPSLTDRALPLQFLPLPSIARQKLLSLLVLIAQAGITVTGSIVRVTGSGLGCDTWPQCHPGSFVPVPGAASALHQAVEFGNRLLTFVLIAVTLATFLAVLRAGRRKAIIWLTFANGIGIILQAVIGGISVLVDLKWYVVALHFLPSMILVWLAGLLYVKVQEPDDGHVTNTYPPMLRGLGAGAAIAMALTLITGTMVTGAGPHAGDADVLPEDRLQLPIIELSHVHAGFMYLYLGLTIGLVFGLLAFRADKAVVTRAWWLIVAIVAQAAIGMTQYWTGVPEVLVPFHVAGSSVVVALTAIVFQMGRRRLGGAATATGSPAGDSERAAKV
ncbi:COX15/CtaA family protein [Corynebacterium sp. 335C]